MGDKTQEFSELPSQLITTGILGPLEISATREPRALSEISELSSPLEISPSSEPLESFYSPAPREPTVQVVSSALTQPSVTEFSLPSAPSASTEPSVPSALTFGNISPVDCDNFKNETISTESENQLSSSEGLNDGSSSMNSSTKFFESLYKYYSDDTIVDTNMIAIETESSTPGTPSLLSDHDGTFSQTSNNFTFYQPPNNEPRHNDVDIKLLASNDSVDSEDSQDFKETKEFKEPKKRPHTYTFNQLPLLHTTSTYPIQQQLRLAKNKMKTKKQYRKEESMKNNYIDNEEEVRVLEIVAEYVTILDNIVKEQNSIISQATQVLIISDMYRQKNSQSSLCNEYSNEHLHAECLLLIANLKRTDAVLEVKRLRYEHYLSTKGIAGRFRFRPPGNGKRLVIESLRVPLLTEVTSDLGTKNMTKWQHEIRYFVCVIRATTTVYRPSMTIVTRLVNVNGSTYQFTLNNHPPYNELGHGYVEFINKQNDSSDDRCPDAGGSPIIIDGLDNSGWKIMIELFGLHPTESGNSPSNNMEHREPGRSSAVRTTMFRQLAFFEIPSTEVDRRQFIVNKVHQSGGSTSILKSGEPEVVRISMQMLEDGENYVYRHINSDLNGSILPTSHEENVFITHNPLKFPPECKLTEGFITLFNDFALRIPFQFEPNKTPKWQHFIKKNVNKKIIASWTLLWFKVEIINDPNTLKVVHEDYYEDTQLKLIMYPQTVILKYWQYRDYGKKNIEPGGIIDLSGCLPLKPGILLSKPNKTGLNPAAQPITILSDRPNTVVLQFTPGYKIKLSNDYPDDYYTINDPLLLDFDTPDERDEWCNTINGAVNAIAAHQEQFIKFCNK